MGVLNDKIVLFLGSSGVKILLKSLSCHITLRVQKRKKGELIGTICQKVGVRTPNHQRSPDGVGDSSAGKSSVLLISFPSVVGAKEENCLFVPNLSGGRLKGNKRTQSKNDDDIV